MQRHLEVIDSHTGGEPTRLVVGGAPDLGAGSIAEKLAALRRDHDWVRTSLTHEPRGSNVTVGAVLCEPTDPSATTGVIFFNNVGYLGMCGHGAIGVVVSLAYIGRMALGEHRLETPVGLVAVRLLDAHRVAVENVPSFRDRSTVAVEVPGHGRITGDIAWGGNWFFLVEDHGLAVDPANIPQLVDFCRSVRRALDEQGITGRDGAEIDHIELFAQPAGDEGVDAVSFVLCPGLEYDRSPCGTGTSAKLACLAADGRLAEGALWRQRSVIGSVFEASYRRRGDGGSVVPTIVGEAYVTGETRVVLDDDDPFRHGITDGGLDGGGFGR